MSSLLSELDKLDDLCPLKVGAIGGTAFFYCGTVGEFKHNIKKYSRAARRRFATIAREAEAALAECIWPAAEPNLRERVQIAHRLQKEFVPFEKRCAADVYFSTPGVEPTKTAVIRVPGNECGKYWLMCDALGQKNFQLAALSWVALQDMPKEETP